MKALILTFRDPESHGKKVEISPKSQGEILKIKDCKIHCYFEGSQAKLKVLEGRVKLQPRREKARALHKQRPFSLQEGDTIDLQGTPLSVAFSTDSASAPPEEPQAMPKPSEGGEEIITIPSKKKPKNELGIEFYRAGDPGKSKKKSGFQVIPEGQPEPEIAAASGSPKAEPIPAKPEEKAPSPTANRLFFFLPQEKREQALMQCMALVVVMLLAFGGGAVAGSFQKPKVNADWKVETYIRDVLFQRGKELDWSYEKLLEELANCPTDKCKALAVWWLTLPPNSTQKQRYNSPSQ